MNLGEKLTDEAVRDFFPPEFFGPEPEPEIIKIDAGAWGASPATAFPGERMCPPDRQS